MINDLKIWWSRLAPWPMGKWIFSRMLGFLIPYTGSVSPHVLRLEHGSARVQMRMSRKVENHLGSIHAIALANLGEFTTGLALHSLLNHNQRAILTNMEVEYLKKARGKMISRSDIVAENPIIDGVHRVMSEVVDQNTVTVARITATWLVGEKKSH